jgi:hypothetical protein
MSLLMNFHTPPSIKCTFSQRSTPPVHMIFLVHVPNSPRNKNMKSGNPYLLQNVVFLASKTLLYPLGTYKKNFFFDFEPCDLTFSKQSTSKIWWACEHQS